LRFCHVGGRCEYKMSPRLAYQDAKRRCAWPGCDKCDILACCIIAGLLFNCLGETVFCPGQ